MIDHNIFVSRKKRKSREQELLPILVSRVSVSFRRVALGTRMIIPRHRPQRLRAVLVSIKNRDVSNWVRFSEHAQNFPFVFFNQFDLTDLTEIPWSVDFRSVKTSPEVAILGTGPLKWAQPQGREWFPGTELVAMVSVPLAIPNQRWKSSM